MLEKIRKIIFIFLGIIIINIGISVIEASTKPELKALEVNQEGLTPTFSSSQNTYSLFIKDSIDKINISAVPSDESCVVEIIGNDNLKLGDNIISINVTDKERNVNQYKIIVTRTSNVEESDSYLQNIIVENMGLSPSFSSQIFEYDLGTIPNKIESLAIFAAANQEFADVSITGNDNLKDGENIITIKVVSNDKLTLKEYKLKVIRESKEDSISDVVETESDINSLNSRSFKVLKIFTAIILTLLIIIIVLIVKLKKRKK